MDGDGERDGSLIPRLNFIPFREEENEMSKKNYNNYTRANGKNIISRERILP